MNFESLKKYPIHIAVTIAFIAGMFSYTTFQCPLSAWIWPAALLFAVRSVSVKKGTLIAIAVVIIPALIGSFGFIDGTLSLSRSMGSSTIMIILFTGISNAIPFVIDRLFCGKIGTARQLFVFPLTLTTMSFFTWMMHFGSITSFVYTQTGFLWFAQGLSIYGILGMTFILGWFATSVNLLIHALPKRDKDIRWSAVCAVVIVTVVIFGGIRLSTAEEPKIPDVLFAEGPHCAIKDGLELEEQIKIFDQVFDTAVKNNAKMIVFYEDSFLLKNKDISSFETHAAKRVKASDIYLIFASIIEEKGIRHNTCTLVTPENGIEWRYNKTNLVVGWENENTPGDGTIHFTDTPIGRITSVICMDLCFPHFVNRIDKNADMLIAPSYDFKGVEGWNARNHSFRAIENGVSLIKATMNGTSVTYDQYGRQIDTYTTFNDTPGSTHMVRASTGGCYTFYGEYGQIIDCMFVICTILVLLSCIYTCWYNRGGEQ